MNVMEMVISAIIKKGIIYEARNADLDFTIPIQQKEANGEMTEKKVNIKFKAEHMSLRIEKEEKS